MQTFPATTHTAALVITLGAQYVAPARMPRELRYAGFKVAMLAPPNAWATQSRYVEQLGHLPADITYARAPDVFAGVVQRITPNLILPGDDAILMTLMQMVIDARSLAAPAAADAPVEALTPTGEALVALIEHSLGSGSHYAASVDKALLVDRGRAAGIPVPPGEAVGGIEDAVRVANALGYPVIMRPTIGTSSVGVVICYTERELTAAMLALPPRSAKRWPQPAAPALVQKYLTGQRYNRAVVGWRGQEIAGYTRTAIERWPNNLGAASVATAVRAPAVAAASAQVTRLLDMSGFAGTQFIDDPDTGKPCLIETNRRMVPATHAGRHCGVDLAAAFAAAVQGRAWTGPTDTPADQQRSVVLFPQEWKRDPHSPHFDALPTDAPWDDAKLFAAMLTSPR